ncbi:hypothetical protein MFIFM68171_04741 [Madurella fahalii]|uniref:Fungal N-terminal domain-containing protein n=1 Tax=Madurella fahalii TaxID=1157608 RepID=A0ABQ0G9Y0_9PEZI
MASPVSFGDAVAMAKIARNIAHAFTKGRKSAPAEFREVENQLYSLSAALSAFKDVCGSDMAAVTTDTATLPARFQREDQDGVQTVTGILDSCRETLKHLEKIVEDYGVVTAPNDPGMSRLKRWNTELLRNYKKIAWTTEAGDLVTLRSQLMVHTNSLDLILGIIMNSRTSRIEDILKENYRMVTAIHDWWVNNLRDATNVTSEPNRRDQSLVGRQFSSGPVSFEVHLSSNGGSQLLCPRACLHDDWKRIKDVQLFVCICNQAENADLGLRHARVEKIALSSLSFPFRQAGDPPSWTLFKAVDKSTDQMVSVTITNVAAWDIVEFEGSFIRPVAEAKANAMLQKGISNQLAHLSLDEGRLRTLNLHSDLQGLHKLVNSVTFRSGDITKTIVHLSQATVPKVDESDAAVVIEGVNCLAFNQDLLVNRLERADVAFQLTSPEPAKKFHQKLKDMRRELLIASLQYPRPDETVVLHLQATEVQCDVAMISDAELLITRSRQDKYRLIVTSRKRCTVVTLVLPDTFFTSPPNHAPRFSSPTWVVHLGDGGKREVTHYPDGFRFLSFHNSNAERMFELGRTAVLQGTPVQALPTA